MNKKPTALRFPGPKSGQLISGQMSLLQYNANFDIKNFSDFLFGYMTHILHTSTVHKTESLADEGMLSIKFM